MAYVVLVGVAPRALAFRLGAPVHRGVELKEWVGVVGCWCGVAWVGWRSVGWRGVGWRGVGWRGVGGGGGVGWSELVVWFKIAKVNFNL